MLGTVRCDEAGQNTPQLGTSTPKIAVAVGSSHSGLHALKWALEKEVPPHGLVYLLHVRSPIRWIPNAMGGKFPVEQVHPEKVKQFKSERLLETEKLINQYRSLCNRKKITSVTCCSESNTVQKELVDQISKLGITTLVLGTSQNVLSRALKVESVSTYVAKHAPDFCMVLVINKDKLCYGKKGTQASALIPCSSSSISEATIPLCGGTSMGNHGDNPRTSASPSCGASLDLLQRSYPQSRLSHSISSNGAHQGHQKNAMKRNQSVPSTSQLLECSPLTCIDQPWDSPDDSNVQLNDRHEDKTSPFNGTHSIEDHFLDSVGMVHVSTPVAANGAIETSERIQYPDLCTYSNSESIQYPDLVTHSQTAMDIGSISISEIPATQRLLPAYSLEGSNMSSVDSLVDVVPQADLLQKQLNEAKLCANRAQREAEWQTNVLMKTVEVPANAKKMVMEYERHWLEASKEALKAMQQATNSARRYEEALGALALAQKDRECIQQKLKEEIERHQKTQMELEAQKRMASSCAIEAAFAKQQVEAERRRCKETIVKLEDSTKRLEIECQLRKEAEERASQDAVARLEAMATLKKERQRYSEYSYEELQSATNGFREENKLGEGGYGPVYRGKLCHTSVAIKVLARDGSHGLEEFQKEVEVLSCIRHPHMLMLLGACPEKCCIVYEYMANGSLEDRLNCKDGTPPLPWYARFRICFEVATALLFLHSQPQPIVHRDLKPANILIDHHFVSKIGDVGMARLIPENLTFSVTMYKDSAPVGTFAYIDPDYQRTGVVSCESDVYSLGIVMLQLLTGKPPLGVAHLVEEAEKNGKLEEVLDKSAGDWSLEEARKLARISLQCTEFKRRNRPRLDLQILPLLESIQSVAKSAAANMASARPSSSGARPVVPSFFFCPILQEVMEDPHMAADGFTYEHCAIKVWLQANNTSPMTNLRLEHKNLTPNHPLRSAIREWHQSGLI